MLEALDGPGRTAHLEGGRQGRVRAKSARATETSTRRRGRRSMAEMRAAQESKDPGTGRQGKNAKLPRSAASTLGGRVRLARKRLNLSQQELAGPEYVASYISAIERDKIHPSLKALELIARRLDEPVEYFLYGGYGSGALHEVEKGAEGTTTPETSFTLSVRDTLLQAQLLLERGVFQGGSEGQALFEQAETTLNTLPRHQLTEYDRATLCMLAGSVAWRKGDLDASISQLEEAFPLAQKTEQSELLIGLYTTLGHIASARHSDEEAVAQFEAARNLLQQLEQDNPPELHLEVLLALTTEQLSQGHYSEAIALFERALKVEDQFDNLEMRVSLYSKIADASRQSGDVARARRYSILALSLYEQLNRRRNLLQLSPQLGHLLTESGREEQAEKVLLRAVEVANRSSSVDTGDLALAYNALAALRLRQGNLAEASRLSDLAINEAHKSGNMASEGNALRIAAEIQTRQDHPDEARRLYEQAINTLEAVSPASDLGDVYKAYGEALSGWGDFENAVTFLKKAYESKS
ncbi:MAG TPA: helix-turn-helix transcriptional regulator [Chloroflexia bacterium]|nr:helix-turn-helix transcriptional regulator [Chloroflexia bacterium]